VPDCISVGKRLVGSSSGHDTFPIRSFTELRQIPRQPRPIPAMHFVAKKVEHVGPRPVSSGLDSHVLEIYVGAAGEPEPHVQARFDQSDAAVPLVARYGRNTQGQGGPDGATPAVAWLQDMETGLDAGRTHTTILPGPGRVPARGRSNFTEPDDYVICTVTRLPATQGLGRPAQVGDSLRGLDQQGPCPDDDLCNVIEVSAPVRQRPASRSSGPLAGPSQPQQQGVDPAATDVPQVCALTTEARNASFTSDDGLAVNGAFTSIPGRGRGLAAGSEAGANVYNAGLAPSVSLSSQEPRARAEQNLQGLQHLQSLLASKVGRPQTEELPPEIPSQMFPRSPGQAPAQADDEAFPDEFPEAVVVGGRQPRRLTGEAVLSLAGEAPEHFPAQIAAPVARAAERAQGSNRAVFAARMALNLPPPPGTPPDSEDYPEIEVASPVPTASRAPLPIQRRDSASETAAARLQTPQLSAHALRVARAAPSPRTPSAIPGSQEPCNASDSDSCGDSPVCIMSYLDRDRSTPFPPSRNGVGSSTVLPGRQGALARASVFSAEGGPRDAEESGSLNEEETLNCVILTMK